MTENSKFVIHWEIDNATATLATGKAETAVFDEGGFRWTAAVQRHDASHNTKVDFILHCDSYRRQSWECDATVGLCQLRNDGNYNPCCTERFSFDENNGSWMYTTKQLLWTWLTNNGSFNINDKVTIEFRVRIVSSKRGEPIADFAMFSSTNNLSNVILKVGDEKLHVSKEFLGIHSPVFYAMFFGDYKEKRKEEVELKDVVSGEFVDLLHLIYPSRARLTDFTVCHVLGLADRFQIERVLALAEIHLQTSKKFNIAEKLCLADQYRLVKLRDFCLKTYSTGREMSALESTAEYASFSSDMKAAICDRMMKLLKQMTDNSNFVLRWEKETGKEESGGIISLRCEVDHNESWECEADLDVTVFSMADDDTKKYHWGGSRRCFFNQSNNVVLRETDQYYHTLLRRDVIMEFKLKIVNSKRCPDSRQFAVPNSLSNVVLKIGDKKVHVSKEYLSIHSPVFAAMFFGDFVEKGNEEVEIKEVVYEEFIDLLNLIYPGAVELTDVTVQHILKLADRFQMKGVMDQAEKYLIRSMEFKNTLAIADQYRLIKLRDHCLQSSTSLLELIQICKSPECANFSDESKVAIYNRLIQF